MFKKTIYIIAMSLLSIILSGCATNFKTVKPQEFQQEISKGDKQILDVRTPEEFSLGHIQDAINVDVKEENFLENAEKSLDKHKVVAVYCRSGKRSAKASEILQKAGYKVINLDGGILAWEEKGMEITQ